MRLESFAGLDTKESASDQEVWEKSEEKKHIHIVLWLEADKWPFRKNGKKPKGSKDPEFST